MLVISDRKSASGTKEYVARCERIDGHDAHPLRFFGKLAELLGIAGEAARSVLYALIDNRTPDGEKLTPRDGENRVVCKDLNFNCPKGVTLAANFCDNGEQVRRAVIDSIIGAVTTVAEPLAEVRAHGPGHETINLRSGAVLVGLDIHESSRAGDPHLHGHAYLMNASVNPADGKRLGLKSTAIHKAAKKIEREFMRQLRGRVEDLGYQTRDKGPFWEIRGIDERTLRKFSTRRSAIEAIYASAERVTPKLRQKAGLLTRDPKPQVIDLGGLRKEWRDRLTAREKLTFKQLHSRPKVGRRPSRAKSRLALLRRLGNHMERQHDRAMGR